MKRFALLLSGLAAAVAGGGVAALYASDLDVPAEVGKWLLTLATALAVTGALSSVVKQIEERRVRRTAWETLLHDIIAAKQTVVVCRLLLRAHKTAGTYRDQFAELVTVRAQLRDIMADGNVIAHPVLRSAIRQMKQYIDGLGTEYETRYLQVARQQLVDEQRLKQLVATAAEAPPTEAMRDLSHPLSAWRMLEDPELFPHLTAMLDDDAFDTSPFSVAYTAAKRLLETEAGIRRPSVVDRPTA